MKAAALELFRSSANIGPAIVLPLEARSKLGGFRRYEVEKEERQKVGAPVVREDEVLEKLVTAWTRCTMTSGDAFEFYENALKALKDLSYSSEDVEKFSIALANFQHENDFSVKAGFFLSALINNGEECNYIIHTKHLWKKIDNLGFWNIKNIIVKGDAGDGFGRGMEGGSAIVEGETGPNVGWSMRDGRITVKGNSGNTIGFRMTGGEIHLESNYKSIYKHMLGGRIYHKGNLIAGEKLA